MGHETQPQIESEHLQEELQRRGKLRIELDDLPLVEGYIQMFQEAFPDIQESDEWVPDTGSKYEPDFALKVEHAYDVRRWIAECIEEGTDFEVEDDFWTVLTSMQA